jgi:chromosomal replication initiation ATPase DnaA
MIIRTNQIDEVNSITRRAEQELRQVLGANIELEVHITDHSQPVHYASKVDIEELANFIEGLLDIPQASIMSSTRKGNVVDGRHILIMIMHKKMHLSPAQIAPLVHRDRTTIIHAISRVQDLIDINDRLAEIYKMCITNYFTITKNSKKNEKVDK